MTIKTKFVLRNYINSQGKSPLYIFVTSPGERIRIKSEFEVNPEHWDQTTERLKPTGSDAYAHNLILDNIESRITKIKTVYMLSEKALTATKLAEELRNTTERVDFLIFFEHQMKKERKLMAPGYYRRVNTVLNKLKKYRKEILFSDINEGFIMNYRIHMGNKRNMASTINSNMATIKKMLISARKMGIKFPLDPEDIKVGKTTGNRTDLSPTELQRFYNYYFSEFIPDNWKQVLGYFLFSCFTGMRWSDIIELDRDYILANGYITFDVVKTSKRQSIAINKKALAIVRECPELFEKKITDTHTNRELKKIAGHLKMAKKLTFHVARHTFATNFLRMGGNVVKLQMILGHSNIRETMIYVHIVEQEANDEMALMDKLF